nr:MAG TPA: hypothetical protein [Caudoviricetes sp.]
MISLTKRLKKRLASQAKSQLNLLIPLLLHKIASSL